MKHRHAARYGYDMRHAPGMIGWIDVFTSDPQRAKDFYQGLFGWTSQDQQTDVGVDYTQFYLDGKLVAGLSPMPPEVAAEGLQPQWMSYVLADDVDATCETTRQAGGQVMMAPMDVMDSGRLANILDPSGGLIGVWQPYEHKGADVFGTTGSLAWSELLTRDMDAALPFYEGVFGWSWESGVVPRYRIARMDGLAIAGVASMPAYVPEEIPAVWLVYFSVADVEATTELAIELGGRVYLPPNPDDAHRTAGILDPTGARFMVVSRR